MIRRLLLCLLSVVLTYTSVTAGDDWKNITTEDGLPSDEIQLITEDGNGMLWIGTNSGLVKREGGNLNVVLDGKAVFSLLQIDTKKYLVGTGNGIFLLNNGKSKHLLKGNQIDPIVHYKGDQYWALGKDPASKTNVLWSGSVDGEWTKVEFFKGRKIGGLFRDMGGTVWVVNTGNGVFEINPDNGPKDAERRLPGFNVNVMTQDSDGDLWCGGMENGVRELTGDSWTGHLQDKDTVIFDIEEGSNGNIWVATNTIGVWQFDGDEWTRHLDGQINMLETTSDGRVWVSSQMKGGLRCWHDSEWTTALESRLPFRTLHETEDGEIWAGSVLGGLFVK